MNYQTPGERKRAAGITPQKSRREQNREVDAYRKRTCAEIGRILHTLGLQGRPGVQTIELYTSKANRLKPFVDPDRIYTDPTVLGPKGDRFHYVTGIVCGYHILSGTVSTGYSQEYGSQEYHSNALVLPNGLAFRGGSFQKRPEFDGFSAYERDAQNILDVRSASGFDLAQIAITLRAKLD